MEKVFPHPETQMLPAPNRRYERLPPGWTLMTAAHGSPVRKWGQAFTGLEGCAQPQDSTLVVALEADTRLSEREDEVMRSCRFQAPEGWVEVNKKGLWVQEVWSVRTWEY